VNLIRFLIPVVWAISIIGCFNPFFPEKGDPLPIESSPARTIELFKQAYERRDIFAFENLIYSTDSFSSYTQVSYDYSASLNIFSGFKPITIDSVFSAFPLNTILPQNRDYYELKWGQEKNIHDRLFSRSDGIVFLDAFFMTNTEYEISDEGDTISVLAKTQPSKMQITYGGNDYLFDITGQVFAMKKKDGFWKIWKWIELN